MADWSKGDYAQTALRLEPAARDLVEAAEVGAGNRVLDVGAGDGNVALRAAHAGADVTALDLTPKLVEEGRVRTAGQPVRWLVGDAQELPFEDGAFDVALSNFAVIFAPDQDRAAAELQRVARRVAITAWTPESFFSRFGRAMGVQGGFGRAMGAEGDEPDPTTWGQADVLRRRLGAEVRIEPRNLTWTFAGADELIAYAQTNPVFAAAPPQATDALGAFAEREAGQADGTLRVVLDYVRVLA